MARRKNTIEIDTDFDGPTVTLKLPPARLPDGKPNPEYFRVKVAWVLEQDLTVGLRGGTLQQVLGGIEKEAKLMGLNLADLMDQRSPELRVREAVDKLLSSDGESALETAEDEIDAIIRGVEDSVSLCQAFLDRDMDDVDSQAQSIRTQRAEAEARLARGKRWASLLRRVKILQRQTRKPVPTLSEGGDFQRTLGWEISYPLRMMLYVYRSDIATSKADRSKMVFQIASHHAKIAYHIWKARHGVRFYVKGSDKERGAYSSIFGLETGPCRGANRMDGCVIVCPPRHGKSSIGTAWMVCEIVQNPRCQAIMLHAVQDEGSKNFRHIREAFLDESSIGRRFNALHPELRLSERDNDKKTMRLELPEPTRDPQLRAVGVRTSVGGANSDIQWWDDPVDPKERDQPEVRADTSFRLMSQVKRRMQGDKSFLLVTATLWHMDDATNRLLEDIRVGKIKMSSLVIGTGGPKTNPEFSPVWPEMYPASKLRQIYAEMRSPSDFSAQYMADPRPDELRIVKKLSFYDPFSDQHQQFLRSCVCHASLDPSATSRKYVKSGTDKAGFIYLGVGEVSVQEADDDIAITTTRRVIRILDAKEFHAGPAEAVEMVKEYASNHRVDKVHVEAVAFSMAIVDSLRNQLNLSSNEVVAHNPRALSKEQRLKAVAPMIDDSLRDQGMGAAVVEFPGEMGEGDQLRIVQALAWLADNILNFGASKNDHAVDALTQVLKTLIGDVDVSGGSVTQAVRIASPEYGAKEIRRRMMERMYQNAGKKPERDVLDEERRFMMQGEPEGTGMEDFMWASGYSS